MKKNRNFFAFLAGELLILFLKFYKAFISPFLPTACRYTPTCSEYMMQAIMLHGVCKGTYLGVKRILRCHPWGGCGADPVPAPKNADKDTD